MFETIAATLLAIMAIIISILQYNISGNEHNLLEKQTIASEKQARESEEQVQTAKIQNQLANEQLIRSRITDSLQILIANNNLKLIQQQIESNKIPSLEVSSFYGDALHICNIGGAKLSDIEIAAYLCAYYLDDTGEITQFQITTSPQKNVLKKYLIFNEDFSIEFFKLTFLTAGRTLSKGEREVYSIVIRFYRVSDMHPFYKIISFIRAPHRNTGSTTTEYLYFPLTLTPGTALGGPNDSTGYYPSKLENEIQKIFINNLNLSLKDNLIQ